MSVSPPGSAGSTRSVYLPVLPAQPASCLCSLLSADVCGPQCGHPPSLPCIGSSLSTSPEWEYDSCQVPCSLCLCGRLSLCKLGATPSLCPCPRGVPTPVVSPLKLRDVWRLLIWCASLDLPGEGQVAKSLDSMFFLSFPSLFIYSII